MFVSALATESWAQTRSVTGKVTSAEDGSTLPGVNVILKGTTTGTVTDIDGNYRITVPEDGGTLVFSFIGLATQEAVVGARSVVDIQMESDVEQLGEVVVTALGLRSNTRDLSYAVTTVDAEEITKVKSPNLLSSLQGKVPGAVIQSTSGQPGSSQRIILRGVSTLSNGSGQPLIIVDGIPINNSQLSDYNGNVSQAGVFADQTDAGNGIADIEPENIKSVTVLKGISAAALYGSRAANGAIIIETKDGSGVARGDGRSQITYSGGLTWESPLRLPKIQTEFGLGQYGNNLGFIDDQETWGDPYDGSLRPFSQIIDNQQLYKRYEATPQTLRQAFNTAFTNKHTISLAGGNNSANYYTSYSYLDNNGIVPGTGLERHNVKVAGGSQLNHGIAVSGSVEFLHSELDGTPQGFGGNSDASFYGNLLRTSADIPMNEARNYDDKFYNVAGYFTPFNGNPFRAAYTWEDITVTNRVFGSLEANYEANDWLNFTVRAGGDFASRQLEQYRPIERSGAPNNIDRPGTFRVVERSSEDINLDALANIIRSINEDINLNITLGYNLQSQKLQTVSAQQPNLGIPDFRSINNGLVDPVVSGSYQHRRALGAYSRVGVGYRGIYNIELQGRNDWSSTLPSQNRSNFYWSAGGNIILSDLIDVSAINFLKVSGTYAKVGNDAPVYSTASTFIVGLDPNISSNADFPWLGYTGVRASNSVGNADLKPEVTSGWEAGLELGLFQSRISLGLTYYNQLSEDQITSVQVPATTGYTTTILNAGAIRNKGVEISLTTIPVETENLTWSSMINFNSNKNVVESLAPGLDEFNIAGFSSAGAAINVVAIPGEEYGLWKYTTYRKDPEGNLIVDPSTGRPIFNTEGTITDGRSIQPDFNAAFINTINYKNISLSFNIQGQYGGYFYSETRSQLEGPGKTHSSTYNMRQPWIVPGSVLETPDGFTPNTSIFVTDPNQYWNNRTLEDHILTATYIKLREVSLSYNFPQRFFERAFVSGASVSIIGANLFIWTPKENRYSDPEQAQGFGVGSDGFPGFELAPIPSTRSYGFAFRVTL